MKKIEIVVFMVSVIFISGCAGTVQKPRIYAPGETNTLGLPAQFSKATGEQRYCAHGLPDLVQQRKNQAYANIAEACGGEDKYSIIDELSGTVHTVALGVETGCAGFAGRVIYFKCKGTKPRPTGYDK